MTPETFHDDVVHQRTELCWRRGDGDGDGDGEHPELHGVVCGTLGGERQGLAAWGVPQSAMRSSASTPSNCLAARTASSRPYDFGTPQRPSADRCLAIWLLQNTGISWGYDAGLC